MSTKGTNQDSSPHYSNNTDNSYEQHRHGFNYPPEKGKKKKFNLKQISEYTIITCMALMIIALMLGGIVAVSNADRSKRNINKILHNIVHPNQHHHCK